MKTIDGFIIRLSLNRFSAMCVCVYMYVLFRTTLPYNGFQSSACKNGTK